MNIQRSLLDSSNQFGSFAFWLAFGTRQHYHYHRVRQFRKRRRVQFVASIGLIQGRWELYMPLCIDDVWKFDTLLAAEEEMKNLLRRYFPKQRRLNLKYLPN